MRTLSSRTVAAAITACALLLVFAAESHPSYDSEAGRKYDAARQRVADLKKSKKRQRYRSNWMACVRAFELAEKKFPKSPVAGEACLERAGLYLDLYGVSRTARDRNQALKVYTSCQAAYPRHSRAPEALFHAIEIQLDFNKDAASANKIYAKLTREYPDNDWTNRAKTRLSLTATAQKKPLELRKPPKIEMRAAKNAPEAAEKQPAAPSSIGTVNGIRQWSSETYTRIVIELDRPLKRFPDTNELKNPARLVFDLTGVRISDRMSKDPLVLNNGILRQVRFSQYNTSTVRVVLDLASLKSYAAFPLHDPERLVIDVTGEEQAAAAGANEPEPVVAKTQPVPQPEPESESKQESESKPDPQPQPQEALPAKPKPAPPAPQPHTAPSGGEKLSLSRQLGLKVRTIAIDAGHGGKDPGAIGKNGLREKTVTLDIAKRLAKLVKEQLGCNVIMTRDKDVFIPLEARPAIARKNKADLFVSVHVNANRKRKAKGIETYIQGLHASDADAMATAARENAMTTKKLSELKSELDMILKDLASANKDDESNQLASAVQTALVENTKPVQKSVLNLGVKRAFFYVLLNTDMPSILAEVGFISNPDEEKLLKQETYRQKIAESLFKGIKQYMDAQNPQVLGI